MIPGLLRVFSFPSHYQEARKECRQTRKPLPFLIQTLLVFQNAKHTLANSNQAWYCIGKAGSARRKMETAGKERPWNPDLLF